MLMFNLFKAEPINYSVRTKTLSWRERDNILHKKNYNSEQSGYWWRNWKSSLLNLVVYRYHNSFLELNEKTCAIRNCSNTFQNKMSVKDIASVYIIPILLFKNSKTRLALKTSLIYYTWVKGPEGNNNFIHPHFPNIINNDIFLN